MGSQSRKLEPGTWTQIPKQRSWRSDYQACIQLAFFHCPGPTSLGFCGRKWAGPSRMNHLDLVGQADIIALTLLANLIQSFSKLRYPCPKMTLIAFIGRKLISEYVILEVLKLCKLFTVRIYIHSFVITYLIL